MSGQHIFDTMHIKLKPSTSELLRLRDLILEAKTRDVYIRSTCVRSDSDSIRLAVVRAAAMFSPHTRSKTYNMHQTTTKTENHTLCFTSNDGLTTLLTPYSNKYVCIADLASSTRTKEGVNGPLSVGYTKKLTDAIKLWVHLFKRTFSILQVNDHLSTNGRGIPWLHLRIEQSPKHYCPTILETDMHKYYNRDGIFSLPYQYRTRPRFGMEHRVFPVYKSNARNRRMNVVTQIRIDSLKPVAINIIETETDSLQFAFDYLGKLFYRGEPITLDINQSKRRLHNTRLGEVQEGFITESDEMDIVIAPGNMSDSYLLGTLLHEMIHYMGQIEGRFIDSHHEHLVMYMLGDDA